MPKTKTHVSSDQQALALARKDRRSGKSPSTQAHHFVHEEMDHMKEGVHPSHRPIKTRKQAIAIGLSKARKYGIPVRRQGGRRAKKVA